MATSTWSTRGKEKRSNTPLSIWPGWTRRETPQQSSTRAGTTSWKLRFLEDPSNVLPFIRGTDHALLVLLPLSVVDDFVAVPVVISPRPQRSKRLARAIRPGSGFSYIGVASGPGSSFRTMAGCTQFSAQHSSLWAARQSGLEE